MVNINFTIRYVLVHRRRLATVIIFT